MSQSTESIKVIKRVGAYGSEIIEIPKPEPVSNVNVDQSLKLGSVKSAQNS